MPLEVYDLDRLQIVKKAQGFGSGAAGVGVQGGKLLLLLCTQRIHFLFQGPDQRIVATGIAHYAHCLGQFVQLKIVYPGHQRPADIDLDIGLG